MAAKLFSSQNKSSSDECDSLTPCNMHLTACNMKTILHGYFNVRHQGTVRIWQWTIFRIIQYRGPEKGLVAL